MQEHQRDETGADGSSQGSGRSAVETGSDTSRADENMEAERPLETADREQPTTYAQHPPAEPMSEEGRRREGVFEADEPKSTIDATGHVLSKASDRQNASETVPPSTTAYTASQRSNLPDNTELDESTHSRAEGSGRMQGAVERRENGLVFDPNTENFIVKD